MGLGRPPGKRPPQGTDRASREHHEAPKTARAWEETAGYAGEYRKRDGIEGTFSRTVRARGLRRSRYRGTEKARLQPLLPRWLGPDMSIEARRHAYVASPTRLQPLNTATRFDRPKSGQRRPGRLARVGQQKLRRLASKREYRGSLLPGGSGTEYANPGAPVARAAVAGRRRLVRAAATAAFRVRFITPSSGGSGRPGRNPTPGTPRGRRPFVRSGSLACGRRTARPTFAPPPSGGAPTSRSGQPPRLAIRGVMPLRRRNARQRG